MATRPWTPADLEIQPVSWLDCDTCRVDRDEGVTTYPPGIVGVYDKEGHSFRPVSGYAYTIGESHINGRRWLGGVSPRDANVRLSLGCTTASGWLQGKPGVTVVGTWWRFDSTDYQTHFTINNVDASGASGTTTAQQMVNIAAANTTNADLNYCWRRLTTDTRSNSTRITGLPKEGGLVLSSRLRSTDAKASFHAGVSATWDGLGAQSGITTGMLAGCSRTAYQVMYGFQRANLSGSTSLALGESLIYDRALSDADVAMVEGYLAHRWGVTDSLPDSHPYKSAPPMVEVPEPESVPDVTEAVRYRDWLPKQAPGWLQKPNGRAWMWAHGDVLDSVDDLAHKAVLARFPDYTTEDGLSLIGGERGIARGADESAADYAARLKDAWTLWQSSGTPAAVLSALRGLGVTNAEIRSEDGRTATLDASGAITYAPPRVTADADERPVRWVTCPDLWHVFQVFIPFEDGPWGEYEMPAADSPEVDALRVAIRRHCGAHAWCDGIVAVNYFGSGLANETPRLVDWPERTIEETWAQDTSEDAWFDQEPSIDNCPRCLWNVSESGPGVTADPEVIPPAPAADLLTGLAHFWGGGASSSVLDLSDAVDGGWALTNAVDWTGNAAAAAEGIFGGAFGIGSASKYAYSTSKNFLAADCSFALWVKPLSTPTGGARFARIPSVKAVGHTAWAGTQLDIIAPTPSTWYRLGLQCVPGSDPAVTVEADAPASFAVGGWNLLVLTWDATAGVATLWANGEKIIEAAGTFIADDNTQAFGIAGASNGNGVAGTYDELAVWTRVLGQAEVQALWNGGSGLPFADWT